MEDDECRSFSLGSVSAGSCDALDDNLDDNLEIESIAMLSFGLDGLTVGAPGEGKRASATTSVVHEGSETHVYRLKDEVKKYGGKTGWVALKILSEQFPEADQISQFGNEYNILKHLELSNCHSARAALRQEEIDGCHALYLEWVDGITIRQWINKHQDESLLPAVRLAFSIATALADIHRSAVVHNNITAENIMLCSTPQAASSSDEDSSSASSSHFSVKIIDFGKASLMREGNANVQIKADLLALGALFFEIFSGVSPFQTDPQNPQPHSTNQQIILPFTMLNSLIATKVPPIITDFIFKLMHLMPNARYYTSADEVAQNLQLFLSGPNQSILTHDSNRSLHQLNFSGGKLYGRAKEASIIQSAYDRVIQSNGISEIVLVHGYSGAGKTTLVREACRPLLQHGGYFISGKFDQLKQTEPLSAIISAFSQYCDEIIKGDPQILSQVRTDISDAIGSEGSFLTTLIPKLNQIIAVQTTHSFQATGIDAQYQFNFIFRNFVRAIASPTRPLIFFLDDLQWADDSSLDLIMTLFTDNYIKYVLFVASFRSEQVNDGHPLDIKLRQIDRSDVTTTKIPVNNITNYYVNELISDTLTMSQTDTQPLADIVYHRTGGNVLFVVQCLKSLCDDGLLYFSSEKNSWLWDTQVIEEKGISDNALELMLLKIKYLPLETQNALKLIACLGSCCEESTLRLIMVDNDKVQNNNIQLDGYNAAYHEYTALVKSLDLAVYEGLMDKKGSTYKFAHDQIQFAAYSLIEESERAVLHLKIGNLLLRNKSAAVDNALFIMVDQLNIGATCITDESKKEELAWLCLKAGEKAFSSSAFRPAASYLKTGMAYLVQRHWEEQYELSLELYNHYSHTQFCIGELQEMSNVLNEILVNAKCFDDKLSTYSTLVSALGAQGKVEGAMEIAFDVLKDLGEPFPKKVTDKCIMSAFGETKEILRGKSGAELLALKQIDNRQKCNAMKFLDQMIVYSYIARQEFLPLFVFRMVKLSLNYGICKESAFGFASYGFLLCGSFGDIKGGYSYGQLALQVLEKLKTYECLPRVYAAVYGCINIWSVNIQLSLEPHMMALKVGMRSGDIEYAIINGQIYVVSAFQAGKNLDTLDEECKNILHQAKEVKQEVFFNFITLTWHAILNLKHESNDPMELTGKTKEEKDFFKNVTKSNISLLKCIYFWHRMILAYIYGNYDLAAEMAEKTRGIDKLAGSKVEVCSFVFYDGLIALALAFQTKETKWIDLAKDNVGKMKIYALHAPCNCQHKLDLLEAEYAVLMGDYDKAATMYDLSIAGAIQNGFKNEEALGYERAAAFYLWRGDSMKSSSYYGRAHNAYLEWGAKAKADALRRSYPF